MSMIEQASRRLEQLGQAGFTVPTSVSRLRVVDDAEAQAARRRLDVPTRALSDVAKAEAAQAEAAQADAAAAVAAAVADAPAHFSPALRPTFVKTPAVAMQQVPAPDVALPPVVSEVRPMAAPLAVAAKAVQQVLADDVPISAATAFFAPSAEAEKALPHEPPFVETAVPATSAKFEPAPAVARVAMTQPPAFSPAVDASLNATSTQRAEPSTRVSFDLERLRGVGYLVPDQVRSEMAEQFRHIKRPLLKNARAKTGPAGLCSSHIMITSALPGEGKTFSSINLAMSMAMEVDTAVLLIDADVVRPSVFNRLGINIKPPGLLDLLTRDDLPLHEALVSTNVPKLTLMASGERNQRSTELLASTAMDRLLARLAVEYPDHVVIFDAPPLLLTNESPVLATKVGQVVVVVEAAKTRRTVIQQAFAALKNCPVVHSVLNKCDEAAEGRRYGYYYG